MSAHLRTPKEREEHRKSLHKSSTPKWRVKYAERCRERLRESRSRLLSKFRKTDQLLEATVQQVSDDDVMSSVQEAMHTEWQAVRDEYSELPEMPYQQSCQTVSQHRLAEFYDFDDYVGECSDEEVSFVIDELKEELMMEERAILAQYEERVRFDENSLCATIDSLSTNDVICPVCQKNVLLQNGQVIFCACGLRLDTAQDCISLDFVRQQLEDCSTQHSATCSGKPVFSLETTLGTQNIIMNCTTCDFMDIIV